MADPGCTLLVAVGCPDAFADPATTPARMLSPGPNASATGKNPASLSASLHNPTPRRPPICGPGTTSGNPSR